MDEIHSIPFLLPSAAEVLVVVVVRLHECECDPWFARRPTQTCTHSQLPYPYWMVPWKTADTLLISMRMPSFGRNSNSLRPMDRLRISKLGKVKGRRHVEPFAIKRCYRLYMLLHVRVLLLVQAVFDIPHKGQGFFSIHTWVSGMLESGFNHLRSFLIHYNSDTEATARGGSINSHFNQSPSY